MVLITDKFSRASAGAGESPNPATTEAVKAEAATSLTVDSTVGWSTTTPVHFIMYDVDSSKKEVPGSRTHWKGLVSSSTTINNLTLTAGTDREYSSGAKVVATPTPAWADDLVEGVRSTLQDDGTLKDNIVTPDKWTNPSPFKAKLSADITGLAENTAITLIYDSEEQDYSGQYDPVTGLFTAKENGMYAFIGHVRIVATAAITDASIDLVVTPTGGGSDIGVQAGRATRPLNGGSTVDETQLFPVLAFIHLDAEDVVRSSGYVQIVGASQTWTLSKSGSYFSGFMVTKDPS